MGFFDNLYSAADRLNSAMERKSEDVQRRLRARFRAMSDSELRNAHACSESGSLAKRLIEEEMERRGMY